MTRIREVMTERLRTCEPQTTVLEVARLMKEEDVGPIPVVKDGRPVGLVTDRDIVVRVVAEGRDATMTTVGDIASGELVTVEPEQSLDEALKLMGQHRVRRLPVVEGDRLVGIVAQADVARSADERETGEVVEEISRED
jgi:CBS domain-containing protein